MTDLLTTPARLDDLGRRARQRYESQYSVAALVAATEAVYAACMR